MKNIYLPNLVIKNSELTPAQKKVAYHLFYISSFAEQEHYLPAKANLAKTLNTTRPTVSAAYKKLEELGFLVIKDETFNFYLESREFHTEDLRNSKLCEMVGHFTRIPQAILYNPELTPAQLDTFIKFFGRNFKFENNATKIVPIGSSFTSASIIAKEYKDSEQVFGRNIRFLKEHKFIDYDYGYKGCKKVFSFCKILEKAWKETTEEETVPEETIPEEEQWKEKYEEALKIIEQLKKNAKETVSEKTKIEPVEEKEASIAEFTKEAVPEETNFVGEDKMVDFLNSTPEETSIKEEAILETKEENEEETTVNIPEKTAIIKTTVNIPEKTTIIKTTAEDFGKVPEKALEKGVIIDGTLMCY